MDTLGVVHLARREYSQAVMVLQDAITLAGHKGTADETRESLRQHLAQAYLDAGERKN
jgi:hypothetical protein